MDIGAPAVSGSTQYTGGTFTLAGAGDIGGATDSFRFAYRQVTGDVTILARVASVQKTHPWSKAGVMMRASLASNAAFGMMLISGSAGSAFQKRLTTGALRTSTPGTVVGAPYWVRLERRGSVVTASQSSNGVTWTTIGTMTMSAPTMYVGMAVTSAMTYKLSTGVFDNVQVLTPTTNQMPAVTLTGPASGATFTAPAAITVTATASDTDGTVAAVDFRAGATLIGTDTTSPYSVSWNSVPAGTYSLTAVVRDNLGATTTSAARTVTVVAGSGSGSGSLPAGWTAADIGAPAVAGATQYSNGSFSVEGAGADIFGASDQFRYVYQAFTGDIEITSRLMSLENTNEWAKAGVMIRETLAASAPETSLVVTPAHGMNFFRRTTAWGATQSGPVGTAGAPYWIRLRRQGSTVQGFQSSDGVTWTAVGTATMSTAAMYVGLAVTSHNTAQAATAVFANVTVRVPGGNQAPAVTLTAPANGATFTAPASIALAATASDTDGTVAGVDFYVGTTLIVTDTSSPYTFTWSGVPAGSYAISARARDNSGAATTSASRTVTVSATSTNLAPTVSLSAPAMGAVFTAPATVAITATASDTDGSVVRVDFYAGGVLIGSDTTSPYSMSWSNVGAGSYAIIAVARDNAGAMTQSGARDIRVDNTTLPRTAVFTPSADHATAVDRYFLEIFPLGANPAVANPVATRDLGKPALVNGEIQVDISSTATTLQPGSYIATVTAIGSGGSARSAASPAFTR